MKSDHKILAIDPSLTSTGFAYYESDGVVFGTIKPKVKDESRLYWIRQHVRKLLTDVKPNIVVYEDYSFGSKGRSIYGIAELGGVLRLELYEQGIDVLFVPPTTLKVFTTDYGFADKETMIAEVRKRHSITEEINHDEADAIALLHLCRCYVGIEKVRTVRKREALTKCKCSYRLDDLQ